MIRNRSKLFSDKSREDLSDWKADFKRFVIASQINIAPGIGQVPDRAKALELAISCMTEDVKIWYENYIRGRNWILNNVLDGMDVNNLNAIWGLNNRALTAFNAN